MATRLLEGANRHARSRAHARRPHEIVNFCKVFSCCFGTQILTAFLRVHTIHLIILIFEDFDIKLACCGFQNMWTNSTKKVAHFGQ